jgi:ABC-type bacteriocin/lantibiotic exporter with double-glycine peptidase domain
MIDIRGWIWFGIHLFLYSTILLLIVIGLICAFAIWYYWFVVRRRFQTKQEINTKFETRSFIFHTLSFEISNNGVIVLNVQLSQLEKQPIKFAQLNERRYQITSFDLQDEQVDIIFAQSNIHLTIKHENFEQQR